MSSRGQRQHLCALVRRGHETGAQYHPGKISSYPIAIACKTGTPSAVRPTHREHYLNAMMIAYLPADDPEIAIGITVEYGGYGARTGDLVVDIANAYFCHEGRHAGGGPLIDPRTVVQEDAAASDTAAQTAPDAANDAQTDGRSRRRTAADDRARRDDRGRKRGDGTMLAQ